MKFTLTPFLLVLLLLTTALTGCQSSAPPATQAAINSARQVMDNFLLHFNERDETAWAGTLAFPHVRIASNRVTVYPDMATFLLDADLDAFAKTNNWAYSTWDKLEVVQASANKVHFTVTFSRHRENHEAYATFDSLYVVELVDGRWGIRARSSFAP